MSGSSKTPIYDPEPRATTNKTAWSYWDLWFCLVALADHDGNLGALAEAMEPFYERLSNSLGEGFRSKGQTSSSRAGWRPRSSASTASRRKARPTRRFRTA